MNKRNAIITLLLIFLLSAGSVIFNSCQDESSIEKTPVKSESYLLNDQEACNYSEKLFSSKAFLSLKAANFKSEPTLKKVKNITSIPDENKLAAYYIINYEEGGFAILSADKRFSPILAFSEDGSMPFELENCPSNLNWCLVSLKKNIEFVRKSNVSATKEIQQEWKDLASGNNGYMHLKNAPPGGGECTDTHESVGPLVSTKWSQKYNFNYLLDSGVTLHCSGLPGDAAYAGCVTIAIAQVMKFHQYPTSYNWNLMDNYTATPTTEQFIKSILDVLPHRSTCTRTGSTMEEGASTLHNALGYPNVVLSNYNFDTAVSDLRMNRPVILAGGPHAWVCDGFNISSFCIFDDYGQLIGGVTYELLHMNWGNHGDGDAWFAWNNFNPIFDGVQYNYNSNCQIIHNIVP